MDEMTRSANWRWAGGHWSSAGRTRTPMPRTWRWWPGWSGSCPAQLERQEKIEDGSG